MGRAQGSSQGRAAIAVETEVPIARHRGNDVGQGVHAADAPAALVRNDKIAGRIKGHTNRGHGGDGGRATIAAETALAVACKRGDDSRGGIHAADAFVIQVSDEEIPTSIHANSDGKPEGRGRGRTTIAAEGKLPVAGNGGNGSGGSIHATDAAIVGVGNEEVAVGVQGDSVGMVQRGSRGRAAIPAKGKSTVAGDGGYDAGGSIYAADAPILRVGDEEIAVCV